MQLLSEQACVPCGEDIVLATDEQVAAGLAQLPEWSLDVVDQVKQLTRKYRFKNFAEALAFTQAVGTLAEVHNHHPALLTEWGSVKVVWWTHKLNGLHQNDFVLAAKTEQLFKTFTVTE